MFKIESSIPVPASRQTTYPFSSMSVGDSFLVEKADPKKAASVRACASVYGKKTNSKFTCKQVEGGVRVWRTA